MDIDSVPFGVDFREHIKELLLGNDILVAVIGPNWLGPSGKLRICDDTDPVRMEIETALHNAVPIVPVLVGGAAMPQATDLPDTIKNLAFRNAATVDGGRDFHQHMDRLIRSIDKLLAEKKKASGDKAYFGLHGALHGLLRKTRELLRLRRLSVRFGAALLGVLAVVYGLSHAALVDRTSGETRPGGSNGQFDGRWIASVGPQGGCNFPSTLILDVIGSSITGKAYNQTGQFSLIGSVDPSGNGVLRIGAYVGTVRFSANRFEAKYANDCGERFAVGDKDKGQFKAGLYEPIKNASPSSR